MATNYPYKPGFKRGSTSAAAAQSMASKAPSLREAVFQVLESSKGLTADECAERLGKSVLSIRPRLSELFNLERIIETGEKRLNDSGKEALVWKVRPYRTKNL